METSRVWLSLFPSWRSLTNLSPAGSRDERHTYRLSESYQLLQSSIKRSSARSTPSTCFPSVNDGRQQSELCNTFTHNPLHSYLSLLVCSTATTQGHKPASHALTLDYLGLSPITNAQLRGFVADLNVTGCRLSC